MDTELDAMLAVAAPRRGPRADQAEGLRRLSVDYAAFRAGTFSQPGWWEAKANAGTKLDSLARWVINQPGAADQIAALAAAEGPSVATEGARVFGCLLLLTGHPLSAKFWWKYAAGDGDRTAAYCLYLRELHHGELGEAQAWFEQATVEREPSGQAVPASLPPVENYYTLLSLFTKNADIYGSTAARPDADLLVAVERLVSCGDHDEDSADHDGIACRPDQRLADTLSAFTSRSA
ncbi:hypothetical protein GCM10009665_56100 [Kitasatospora nipponensis]|uniref:Tetratricopeptide repeat protein n=1 Tax=Kitasatospora nipponensis TaxID=258049 RepID=A0ABP4HC01_9ACTN